MFHSVAEEFRSEISRINQNDISKLKSKYISLYNNSYWKDSGRADLVEMISSIKLSSAETEALSFGLKFATRIKNNDMEKLIDLNNRHHDSNFHKYLSHYCCFHQLPYRWTYRYITAFKSLSSNHSIIISPSDKGDGVVVDSSDYYFAQSAGAVEYTDCFSAEG